MQSSDYTRTQIDEDVILGKSWACDSMIWLFDWIENQMLIDIVSV